jgi:hypothetical protein
MQTSAIKRGIQREIPKGFTGSYPIEILVGRREWRKTPLVFQQFPHMPGHCTV